MEKFKNSLEENAFVDNVIDLREIFYYLFKGKKIISFLGILGLILGGFFSLNQKNIWQGKMQIVLDSESSNNSFL